MRHYLRLTLLCLCSLGLTSTLLANPSTKSPETLLKIRAGDKVNGDYLAADYAAISQRYAKAKATGDELWKRHAAKKLTLGDGRQVGPQAVLLAALKRDADFLQLRAEASGWDLAVRVDELENQLSTVVREVLLLPGINLTPLQQQLQKAHTAGLKRLPQIETLIAQKKFVQAEGELYEILDDMTKFAVWFPTTDNSTLFKPFQIVPIEQARQARRDQAVKELQAIVAQAPNLAQIQTELAQHAAAVGGTGQTNWKGATVTGSEFLSTWQQSWPKLQAATKRSLLAQWAIEQIAAGESKYVGQLAAQQQFAQALPAAMAAIIQADAQRAAPADAARLYPQYFGACAMLCAVGPRQELETAFAPALTALAAKAGLEGEVNAYRAATEPLLAWKRFFARAQAKSLAAGSISTHDWCTKSLGTPFQPNTIMPDPNTDISRAKVGSSANLVLAAAIPSGPPPALVVNDVATADYAILYTTERNVSNRCVARYQQRVFAVVGAPPKEALKAAADQLEQQLLVSPENPPLTLEAATALATARLGMFEKAGGPLDQATIEPLLTRFITMTDEAGTMLPLGSLPEAFDPNQTNEQGKFLSIRCDLLQPTWFQHECFVIQP